MSADVQFVIPSIDGVVPLHITPHLSLPLPTWTITTHNESRRGGRRKDANGK